MVKIGVIGYGYWGPNLVRNFAEVKDARVALKQMGFAVCPVLLCNRVAYAYVRIPLHSISRSGRIRSGFRASDQESERSGECGGWSGGGLGLGLGFQTFLAAHG